MTHRKKMTLLGGDKRLTFLANILCQRGSEITVYGVEPEGLSSWITQAENLEQAVETAEILILPVPVTRDGEHIVSAHRQQELNLEKLLTLLRKEQLVFGGNFPNQVREKILQSYDFMEMEEVALRNGIATAEGAIGEAIFCSQENLHGSGCLVLGYGRCGKILADRLKGLGARVTVAARNREKLAQAQVAGHDILLLQEMSPYLHRYRFLFNTIPAPVLGRELLEQLSQRTTILDIASAPGGVDFAACEELGISAKLCPGLPGKYAPFSSAEILAEAVLSRL